MPKRSLKIAFISSEVAPYSRTGGLADVSRDLPNKLTELKQEVIVITPFYSFIKKNKELKKEIEEVVLPEKIEIEINKKRHSCKFKKSIGNNHACYFIKNDKLFNHSKLYGYPNDGEGFLFFNLAVFKLLESIHFTPDIIHCNDWQSALIPNYLKCQFHQDPFFENTATLLTIHNLTFQGPKNWWKIKKEKQNNGRDLPPTKRINNLNFLKRGIRYADVINTVSERYAQEIVTPEFGQGLDKLLRQRKDDFYGIINGIDYKIVNPKFDKNIYVNYDWDRLDLKKKNKIELQKEIGLAIKPNTPLIGIVSRLTEQKGIDLIQEIIAHLLNLDLQLAIVGTGEKEYKDFFKKIAAKHPKKIAIITPFSEKMGSRVYAASDIFLMPSSFEPCGISPLISLRYGSIPVVHETGGLSETFTDFNPKTGKGNGFVFKRYWKEDLLIAIIRALENYKNPKLWNDLTWKAMKLSYSWELPAKKYLALYKRAVKKLAAEKK